MTILRLLLLMGAYPLVDLELFGWRFALAGSFSLLTAGILILIKVTLELF